MWIRKVGESQAIIRDSFGVYLWNIVPLFLRYRFDVQQRGWAIAFLNVWRMDLLGEFPSPTRLKLTPYYFARAQKIVTKEVYFILWAVAALQLLKKWPVGNSVNIPKSFSCHTCLIHTGFAVLLELLSQKIQNISKLSTLRLMSFTTFLLFTKILFLGLQVQNGGRLGPLLPNRKVVGKYWRRLGY